MLSKIGLKSEFSRSVLTLMTGTTIAQAIPIAFTPILTRIYTPEDFGILALFVAIIGVFGAIANGRYELAIMLPEKDEDAFNTAALALIIASIVSLLLFIVITIFNDDIANVVGVQEYSGWLYIIPLSVLFVGFYNVFNSVNNRFKGYKLMANAAIFKSFTLVIFQLSLALITKGAVGLIVGQSLSAFVASSILYWKGFRRIAAGNQFSLNRMKFNMIRYIKFPKYSLFAVLANTLSVNLTNILISSLYSISTLGFYSLVNKVLGLPTAIIGGAMGQVFYRQVVSEINSTGKADKVFKKTLVKLSLISLVSFGMLYIFVEEIFVIAFGESWIIAGTYAKILIPYFGVRFVVSSLSLVNSAFEKQKLGLYWQVGLLVIAVCLISIASTNLWGFSFYLKLTSIVLSLYYLVFLFGLYLVSKNELKYFN